MTATLTIIPTDLKIGQQVDIESRTWPGINKPGGHATITKLHYDTTDGSTTSDGNGGAAGGAPTKIDVKYVLGGTEKQIEITYVKPYVELVRGGRSRRVDKKMTVDSFTTGEKENNGAVGGGGKKRVNKRKAVGADTVDNSVHKKKKVVQNKNKNDGIAAANKIEEEQPKVVEDDDTKKKKKTKPAPSKKEGKKKATASAATNKTKSIASYFTSASSATTTTTTTSAKAKGGPSKPKEETTNKKAKKTNPNNPPTTATKPKPTKNPKAVKYSPNSILAVRAAHAKSPTQSHIFGTKTIGFSNDTVVKDAQSLLEGSWISSSANVRGGGGVGSKKKKRSVQESLFPEEDEGEDRKSAATTAVATTVASLPKKKVTPSSVSGKKGGVSSSSSSNTKDKSVQNHKTIQSLYKNECVKAKDFVTSMFGSATKDHGGEKMEEDGAASSPESCLELKMDSGRMDLFNSLLSEVMFKKGLESMDVDEMICSINTSSQRGDTVKPFTLLEVKAFLQTLDSQNRIFVSWEEDNSGTIYTI